MLKTKTNLKRKKRVCVPKEAPLPVPVATALHEPSHIRSWFYYTGYVEGSSIVVKHSGDMDFLYKMGFFGKGSLSRSKPNFAERKQKVNFCIGRKGQEDVLSPLSNMVVMSKRNYLVHKRYQALSEGRTKELEDVVLQEENQHYQPKLSDSEEDSSDSEDYSFRNNDNLARAQAFQLLKYQRLTPDSGSVPGADKCRSDLNISKQIKLYLTAMLTQVFLLSRERIATFLCAPYTMSQLVLKIQEIRNAELNASKQTRSGVRLRKGEVITLDEDDAKDTPIKAVESFVILDSDEEQQNGSEEGVKEKASDSHWHEFDGGDVEFWSSENPSSSIVNKFVENSVGGKSVTETEMINKASNSNEMVQGKEMSVEEPKSETEKIDDVKADSVKRGGSVDDGDSLIVNTHEIDKNLEGEEVVVNQKETDENVEDEEEVMNPKQTEACSKDNEVAMNLDDSDKILEDNEISEDQNATDECLAAKELAKSPKECLKDNEAAMNLDDSDKIVGDNKVNMNKKDTDECLKDKQEAKNLKKMSVDNEIAVTSTETTLFDHGVAKTTKETLDNKKQVPFSVTPMLCDDDESSDDSDDVICIESQSAEPKKLQKYLSLPAASAAEPVVTKSVTFMSNNTSEPQFVSAKVGFTNWGPVLNFNYTGDSSHLPTAMFLAEQKTTAENTEIQKPMAYVRLYPPVESLIPTANSRGVTIRQRLKELPCLSTAYLKVTTQPSQSWGKPSSSGVKPNQQPLKQAIDIKQTANWAQPQKSGKIRPPMKDMGVSSQSTQSHAICSFSKINFMELQSYLCLYQCRSEPADTKTCRNTASELPDSNTHINRIPEAELQSFSDTVQRIVELLKPDSVDVDKDTQSFISKEECHQEALDSLSSEFHMKLSELISKMGASFKTELAWLGHLLSKPESRTGDSEQILTESQTKLTSIQRQLLESRYCFLKNLLNSEIKQTLVNLKDKKMADSHSLNKRDNRFVNDDTKISGATHDTRPETNEKLPQDTSACAVDLKEYTLKRQKDQHSNQENEPKGKKSKYDDSVTESVESISADGMMVNEGLKTNNSVTNSRSPEFTNGSEHDSKSLGKCSDEDEEASNSQEVSTKRRSSESLEHNTLKGESSKVCQENEMKDSLLNDSCIILDNSALNDSCVLLDNSVESDMIHVVSMPNSSASKIQLMDRNQSKSSEIGFCKQLTNQAGDKLEKDVSVPVQHENVKETSHICISSSSDEDGSKGGHYGKSCGENVHPYSVVDDEHPDALIMDNTSDGESADEDNEHRQRWQPCLKKDPYPVKERLHLMLEEAFFLSYGLGCLRILDSEMKMLNLREMWHHFQVLKDEFIPHYVAYHYFRSKGWVPKSGLKFGCDFILYKEGPPFFHGSYSVIVSSVKEKSLLPCTRDDGGNFDQRQANWIYLAGVNRITEQVAKSLMMCYVIWPAQLCKEDTQSPSCISKFKVKEVVISRWIPSQERENKMDEIP